MINYSEVDTKKYINAMYEKAKNTEDPIRRIVKLHALDVLYGNNGRDDLNYVDALYPAVEALFTTDVCIESIEKKTVLKAYYEENYSCEEIDYDLYCAYAQNASNANEKGNVDELIKACNGFVDATSFVSKTKKVNVK